jgi:hypothetical protein
MMSENDYLLDEVYREIDLIVNTAEDEEDAIISILESPYPFYEEQALKLVRRFKKATKEQKESKDGN